MKTGTNILLGILMSTISIAAYGQERWTAVFRPGLHFPTGQIVESDPGTGFGFEATIAFEIIPQLSPYVGWGWNSFEIENALGIAGFNLEDIGYSLGLQYLHTPETSALSYVVRAGAVFNKWEIEDTAGNQITDTGYGPGWLAEAGVDLSMGGNWSLRPTLRYRSLTRNLEFMDFSSKENLSYLSIGVGLAKRF